MAWQGARLRPSRYSASGGSRRPQRKIEHRSLPPASIAASDSVRTERKGERRPLAPRRSGMSPKASHRVRPGLSSAASLMTTLLISFDQEVLNQHLNLVTPEYPFFESPWDVHSAASPSACLRPILFDRGTFVLTPGSLRGMRSVPPVARRGQIICLLMHTCTAPVTRRPAMP